MVVLVAMIEAFMLLKNQTIMPLWHLPPQAHQVLIMRKSQFDVLSYKLGLESVEARLVVYQQNENVFEEDIKLLKLDVILRNNALVELRKKFKKAKKERDELKHTLEKFQTSSKNLSKLLESQITDKTGLGYDNQMFTSTVFDCDELNSSETSVKPVEHSTQAKNLRKDTLKSRGHKHSWTKKACFVCKSLNHLIKDCDYYEKQMIQKPVRNHTMRVNHQHYARMSHPHTNRHVVPTTVLTRSRLVQLNAARPVTTAVPRLTVTSLRPVKHGVNKAHSPIRRPINHRPSPKHRNLHKIVTTVKVKKVNAVKSAKGNWMCNKKNSVLFTDTECVVLSFDFKLLDENHVLLRVPKENNMYNVDLKNVVPLGDLTCLFAKTTLDESHLWHRRLSHINFKTMNKLVK
nr:ribonuclease H-like domain-containing protein [Tanacetum cinerariifolium]